MNIKISDKAAMGQRAKACYENRFQISLAVDNLIAAIENLKR